MNPAAAVIIVTHNSQGILELCLASLSGEQNVNLQVIVVDSGSADNSYLHELKRTYGFELVEKSNIGFSRANNAGYKLIADECQYVVFLNPDTILPKGYLHQAIDRLASEPGAAIISGTLAGYDPENEQPTGRIDSTGVFRKWYGRWHDRDQGDELKSVQREKESVPAVCGALMVCRKTVLDRLEYPFDPDFFLYKEDIELSLRLRKHGWQLLYDPALLAYHCRGWKVNRKEIPKELKLTAARSEILLYIKHPSGYIFWAMMKYLLVRLTGV